MARVAPASMLVLFSYTSLAQEISLASPIKIGWSAEEFDARRLGGFVNSAVNASTSSVLPALLGSTTSADNATAFAGNPVKKCADVLMEEENFKCFQDVSWAMTTGIKSNPEYYANFTSLVEHPLSENSSRLDFQCALASMVGKDDVGQGHGCPVPCNSIMPYCKGAVYADDLDKGLVGSGDSEGDKSTGSGFPWWAWLLIVCPLLMLAGGLAYYFLLHSKKGKGAQKKKKRAAKAPAPAAAPAIEPEPMQTALVAPPVYVNSSMPVMAAPVYTAAPRTMQYVTATPVPTTSNPMQQLIASPTFLAQPVATYAAPVAVASMTSFDQIG